VDNKYLLSHLHKRPSPISGFGLFVDTDIYSGEILFIAADLKRETNVTVYPIQLVNHSKKKANVALYKDSDFPYYYFLRAKHHIYPRQELLLDYTTVPDFFLSQEDKNMLLETAKKK
jgi:hypothetical protein